MNESQARPIISRRDLAILLAISGVTAAGGYFAYTLAPWLKDDEQAKRIRRPLETSATSSARTRELVRYAALAASGHNTQPWEFAVSDNAIEIRPDYARRLPVVDPVDRELWISLGCALENLLIAARAAGYEPEVTYPDAAESIHVRLTRSILQRGALFDAIPLRQNTRSEFNGQVVKTADLDEVQALPLEPGVVMRVVTDAAALETLRDSVAQGNLSQYADPAFVDELIHWIRFNKKEALASRDGLHSRCTGNPEVPRWAGRLFVAGTKPRVQADADTRKLRSSAGAVVVASESDSRTAWVRTGQVYERLALALTSLNIRSALLNQPIEVARVRGQLQSAMGLGAALPQMLVRFGHADPLPFSLRRPVEQVVA